MEALFFLIPVALALGLLGLGAFLWSLKSRQFDDLDGAAWRAIMDDDLPPDRKRAPESREPREPGEERQASASERP